MAPHDHQEAVLGERIDRRSFVKMAGGALVAGSLAAGCEEDSEPTPRVPPRRDTFFTDDLRRRGGWGDRWMNVRYDGAWDISPAGGRIEVRPALKDGLEESGYIARPVLAIDHEASDPTVTCRVELEGAAQAGVVAHASFDEAYALVVDETSAVLCRYERLKRRVLDRAELPKDSARTVTLAVRGDTISGRVRGKAAEVVLQAGDATPLEAGFVGVAVNPTSLAEGGSATFTDFRAVGTATPRRPRFVYRFAGGIVPAGQTFRAHVTARTVVAQEVAFELARDPEFEDVVGSVTAPARGELGSAHAVLEDLAPATQYHWRPVAPYQGERVVGKSARIRTPALSGDGVTFVFGSCTSGKQPAYPSFDRARSYDPEFFLHAGDWGYADGLALDRTSAHFQSRWIRLLRGPSVQTLVDSTPLMFWQDDHDYGGGNVWGNLVSPQTIRAFDELHANPSDEYFDLRWGDVHVFCLDCRLFADDPTLPDDHNKSLLGRDQKAWLKESMASSDAPVRLVASPRVFRTQKGDDPGWPNAYTTERDELLRFFSGVDATVAILSGDVHGHRLIHHFEFGDLFEFNCSGTDFDRNGHDALDEEHTLAFDQDANGFAVVSLEPAGAGRRLHIRVVRVDDGSTLFERSLPVASGP